MLVAQSWPWNIQIADKKSQEFVHRLQTYSPGGVHEINFCIYIHSFVLNLIKAL